MTLSSVPKACDKNGNKKCFVSITDIAFDKSAASFILYPSGGGISFIPRFSIIELNAAPKKRETINSRIVFIITVERN